VGIAATTDSMEASGAVAVRQSAMTTSVDAAGSKPARTRPAAKKIQLRPPPTSAARGE
jgi:hypothetical protein